MGLTRGMRSGWSGPDGGGALEDGPGHCELFQRGLDRYLLTLRWYRVHSVVTQTIYQSGLAYLQKDIGSIARNFTRMDACNALLTCIIRVCEQLLNHVCVLRQLLACNVATCRNFSRGYLTRSASSVGDMSRTSCQLVLVLAATPILTKTNALCLHYARHPVLTPIPSS